MKYIISNFSKWKSINEAESPGKTKQTAGVGQRVVGIPVDEKSFKIKIIRDLDVIDDATKKIKLDAWNSILQWIKAQPKWLPYYPGLNDLKTNFIIYVVNTDNDRKQLLTFTIEPRTSAPGLPETVQIVGKDELATLIKDVAKANLLSQEATKAAATKVDTTVAQPAQATQTKALVLAKPLSFDEVKMITSDKPLFAIVDNTYLKLMKMPEIASLAFFPKVKSELKIGKLGDNSVLLIKGIIAAYNIKDKYGDTVDVVNQDVVNKMTALVTPTTPAKNESNSYFIGIDGKSIVEQDTNVLSFAGTTQTQKVEIVPTGFNTEAFIKATGGAETSTTGDIKLPEGGIKQGAVAKGDAELKKVQNLLITKLEPVLKTDPIFIKFKGYGADGDYGTTTSTLVKMAKAGFDLKDQDGSTITAELINKLLTDKITESYLGLDYRIYEKFNVEAAVAVSKQPAKTADTAKTDAAKKEAEKTTEGTVEDKAKQIQELLISASMRIKAKFEDTAFWKEFKDSINDDEDGAALKFYKWWNSELTPMYITKALNIYKSLPESKEKELCKKNINTLIRAVKDKSQNGGQGMLITKLKGKYANGNLYNTTGDTDTFIWAITRLDDGMSETFSVDTDF